MNYIWRLGYVAATLISLQISPLQIAFRPLGDEIARGQTTEQLREEVIRLNILGLEQLKKGENQEAFKTFEQALAISKQISDKLGEGKALNNFGLLYRNLGQYSKALHYYQQSLSIRKKIGDKSGEGTTLSLCRLQRLQRMQIKPLTLLSFSTTYRVVT
jgi:Tfp pilus assembly protein PilF